MEAAVRKILFYTAKDHLPKSYSEFEECKRDAGPRLIDYAKIPWSKGETELKKFGLCYSPVSRFYPSLPTRSARPSDEFVRPADAPRDWRDTWVEQALFSSGPAYNSNIAAGGLSTFALELSRSSGLAQDIKNKIQENIQRTIIRFAYQDLRRHPSAAPLASPRYLIAASPDDLLQAAIGSFPAVSQVQLFEDDNGTLSIGRGARNRPWAMRGRGPAYSKNTAVIGCMITVDKLLDAGSTNADRKDPNRYSQLTSLQRAFVELSEANWDLCTLKTGARMIDDFRMLIDKDDFGDNSPNAVGLLWDAVSSKLGQMLIEYEETTSLCECRGAPNTCRDRATHCIAPPFSASDSNGVAMHTLFERTFDPNSTAPCEKCGKAHGVRVKKAISRLPLRLAMKLPPNTSVLDHTKDVTFKYLGIDTVSGASKDVSAMYRWLGGIYCDNGCYRVFWNNPKIGEVR
ncbi:hypothetical protein BDV06DRAFT_227708 [Aspergillus oleicola]